MGNALGEEGAGEADVFGGDGLVAGQGGLGSGWGDGVGGNGVVGAVVPVEDSLVGWELLVNLLELFGGEAEAGGLGFGEQLGKDPRVTATANPAWMRWGAGRKCQFL